jgi:hypothetical protein
MGRVFIKDVQKREFDSTGIDRSVHFDFVNASSGGNTQLVAAQGGLRIVVLEVCIITSAAQSVKFQSATTDISCAWPLATNGGLVLPYGRHGWLQTNIGEALNVNLSGGSNTAVQIAWIPSL